MASDVGVGDKETPKLDVTPFDGTTSAALTVTNPAGTTTPVTTSILGTSGATQTWAGNPVTYTAPGRWVLHWTVTGTGAGSEHHEVHVVASPVAGGPTWTPGRSRVANYVPGRTLSVDANTHELTFTSTTRPTGVMVDRLITDMVARITGTAGTVHTDLQPQAAVITAMWAAAAVERGFPDDQQNTQSLQRANDLEKRADLMLTELIAANTSLNGGDDSYGIEVAPMWSFPAAPAWGDLLL